ncbi:hypothetical protein Tco_0007768 [Tanacetum coccineum]
MEAEVGVVLTEWWHGWWDGGVNIYTNVPLVEPVKPNAPLWVVRDSGGCGVEVEWGGSGGCSLNVCGAVLALFGSFPGLGSETEKCQISILHTSCFRANNET